MTNCVVLGQSEAMNALAGVPISSFTMGCADEGERDHTGAAGMLFGLARKGHFDPLVVRPESSAASAGGVAHRLTAAVVPSKGGFALN